MTFEEIKELIITINKSNIALFEFKNKDVSITMDKSLQRNINKIEKHQRVDNEEIKKIIPTEDNNLQQAFGEENHKVKESELVEEYEIVKSPMVGTFYNSPSPDKDPFCIVGSKVSKGNVLCIIEAMKLMNEIESPYDGEVLEILVENGNMIEYGQPLFKIRK
ncbi:biotin carboxyl carrier protein [Clostridium amylolyticum]|uniref:Biotin carboxyl carrier protein of acetyl-CoA carboxylase n=1 Tax=Clostridium amylolyticum TaxID=1121298 RepID=A0A1M6CYI9_9CLOT|nr:acetyl-CoA carboxylase biotin carboxyl carrier protein [Clostridium amylolyticum]SHI66067.1 biotin carboxyl carrier protein [Clostridium amylolyticum]